ncbi:hypothetical protein B4914_06235 [Yersinia entomophaga]|nr:hypothetical protein B4914_06235 [Yersinia entomophaga]
MTRVSHTENQIQTQIQFTGLLEIRLLCGKMLLRIATTMNTRLPDNHAGEVRLPGKVAAIRIEMKLY